MMAKVFGFQVEFAPDLCSRVTFVNFTVTRSSLQSQCLNQVLKAERPDVDAKRSDLLKLQGMMLVRAQLLLKGFLVTLTLPHTYLHNLYSTFYSKRVKSIYDTITDVLGLYKHC